MKLKTNYIIIPLIVIDVALLGGYFSGHGMVWYNDLFLPLLTPPKWVFPLAWNTIFLLATISALIFWNKKKHKPYFNWIIAFFIFNAILNVLWSFLFFGQHNILAALIEIFFLWGSVLTLVVSVWHSSKLASVLLWPYLIWVGFATYLNYLLWVLN